MLRQLVLVAALGATTSVASSCGCNGTKPPPPNRPSVDVALQRLASRNAKAESFRARAKMDYWIGDDRVRGTVLVQGKRGKYMRFNALNPGSENVAVDLACSGQNFKYLNYNDNCKLVGPCDEHSIAQLLRVGLAPDDFLLLAMGSTPLIEGQASSTWDGKKAREVITVEGTDGRRQWIELDIYDGKLDVLYSEITSAGGDTEWKLTNKDWKTIQTEAGADWRVPGKSRFEQPKDKADLIVDWEERWLNLELEDALFDFQLNMGIRDCG